jgi:apolipoprotein N-acyltransferase
MAKKNSIPTLALLAAGTILFSLAWLMPSFPLLVFIGLAPFIAIAVNNRKEKSIWTSLELILLGLTISFFMATLFNKTEPAYIIGQAIIFTMAFLGYTFVRKNLGPGVSLITIALFWLAIEYLLLKWNPASSIYLADALQLKPEWVRWNSKTGYLGASLWILITNILVFQAVLTANKTNWLFVILFVLSIAVPITYSYLLDSDSITKDQLVQLYQSKGMDLSESYNASGELIPRTSAWISVLILLFTFVKRKTNRNRK